MFTRHILSLSCSLGCDGELLFIQAQRGGKPFICPATIKYNPAPDSNCWTNTINSGSQSEVHTGKSGSAVECEITDKISLCIFGFIFTWRATNDVNNVFLCGLSAVTHHADEMIIECLCVLASVYYRKILTCVLLHLRLLSCANSLQAMSRNHSWTAADFVKRKKTFECFSPFIKNPISSHLTTSLYILL